MSFSQASSSHHLSDRAQTAQQLEEACCVVVVTLVVVVVFAMPQEFCTGASHWTAAVNWWQGSWTGASHWEVSHGFTVSYHCASNDCTARALFVLWLRILPLQPWSQNQMM